MTHPKTFSCNCYSFLLRQRHCIKVPTFWKAASIALKTSMRRKSGHVFCGESWRPMDSPPQKKKNTHTHTHTCTPLTPPRPPQKKNTKLVTPLKSNEKPQPPPPPTPILFPPEELSEDQVVSSCRARRPTRAPVFVVFLVCLFCLLALLFGFSWSLLLFWLFCFRCWFWFEFACGFLAPFFKAPQKLRRPKPPQNCPRRCSRRISSGSHCIARLDISWPKGPWPSMTQAHQILGRVEPGRSLWWMKWPS